MINDDLSMVINEDLNNPPHSSQSINIIVDTAVDYEPSNKEAANANASNVLAEALLNVSVSMAEGNKVLTDSWNLKSCSDRSDAIVEDRRLHGSSFKFQFTRCPWHALSCRNKTQMLHMWRERTKQSYYLLLFLRF